MFTIFYGSDTEAVRTTAQKKIDTAITAGHTINRIDSESYESGVIADALGAHSLFGGEEFYVIDTPSDNADFNEEVMANLAELAESTNTFVVIEGALLAAPKKKYEKHAAEAAEYKAVKAEAFNTFAMADALAGKDKRRLWLLLSEARNRGLAAEEIIGVLWWQLKSLRLAGKTAAAAEAGMKDFPYNKAKRALVAFKPGEIETQSVSLLRVYHDGHMGRRDINDALEHWVLSL